MLTSGIDASKDSDMLPFVWHDLEYISGSSLGEDPPASIAPSLTAALISVLDVGWLVLMLIV